MPGGKLDGFVLRSDHARILDGVYSRYDLAMKVRTRTAYWRGTLHGLMFSLALVGVAVFVVLCALWG